MLGPGVLRPAGAREKSGIDLPICIVAKLHAETVKLLRQPDVKEKIAFAGTETVGNSPEEFAAYIRAERAKYAKIVKEANIRLD